MYFRVKLFHNAILISKPDAPELKNDIKTDKDYEKIGEVNNVCFVEGLVYFKNKWFLYYGTADSKIAVAVFDPALSK